jgi:hypothetical protein
MEKRKKYMKALILFEGVSLLSQLLAKAFPDYDVYSYSILTFAVNIIGLLAIVNWFISNIFKHINETKLAHYQYISFKRGAWLMMFSAAAITLTSNASIGAFIAILGLIGTILIFGSIGLSLYNLIDSTKKTKYRTSEEINEKTMEI